MTAGAAINGVVLQYVTPDGEHCTLGPVGSGCDMETTSLMDPSVWNPANRHGPGRRWTVLKLKAPAPDDAALQIGALYLTERNIAARDD